MDGFPKPGLPCIVILPAPMRKDRVFMGLKNSVLMIEDSDLPPEQREILSPEKSDHSEEVGFDTPDSPSR